MHARQTTIQFAPSEPDPSASIFEQTQPLVRELPGFVGMLILSELNAHCMIVLTFWESAAALERAEPMLEKIKAAETSKRKVESHATVRCTVAGSTLTAYDRYPPVSPA